MSCPATDVIIPVHNAYEDTKNCIETLLLRTPSLNRVLLVDDYSSPPTTSYLMDVLSQHPTWLYIRTGQQKWFTRASNIGFRLARTERSVLLNSDCVLGQGWLEEMYDVWADACARGLRVGLVGSILSDAEPRRWVNSVGQDYVTGHCWLVSISALQEASNTRGQPGWYLDETQVINAHIRSDVEICWTLNRIGWATIKSFKSAVGHIGGKSWGQDIGKLGGIKIGDPLKGEILSR